MLLEWGDCCGGKEGIGKVGRTAVGDVADTAEDEEEIELDVQEGFFNLVGLEMLVLDAGLVVFEAFDGDALLALGKELGCDGRVGCKDVQYRVEAWVMELLTHQDGYHDSPGTAEATNNDKFVAP